MRLRFTDIGRIKRRARRAVEDDTLDIQRWWSRKYNRPPNDPLFLEKSASFWIREMYEDVYDRKVTLESQLKDDALKMEERRDLSQRLRAIYKAIGEGDPTKGEDPLIDKWERELDEGKTPDLDEKQ